MWSLTATVLPLGVSCGGAQVELAEGAMQGHRVWLDYEDVSKLASRSSSK
jgi:hypothetical protein